MTQHIVILVLFIFPVPLCITSCTTGKPHNTIIPENTQSPSYTWYNTDKKERAVALVVHGLNTKPEKMGEIINILCNNGVRVLLLRLMGHRSVRGEGQPLPLETDNEMNHITRDIWVSEMAAGFKEAGDYGRNKGIPVIFTGFSLGCAAGLDAACSQEKRLFDYALFFAPAITLRTYACSIKIFYIFGNNFVIPSKAPLPYRAYKGTTVAAYKALFHHVREIKNATCANGDVPTLCFIDPDDELVRSKGLVPFLEKKKWTQWEIIYIHKEKKETGGTYHHLIIDPSVTGRNIWNTIENRIIQFLDTYV